jgi:hypothetical protein
MKVSSPKIVFSSKSQKVSSFLPTFYEFIILSRKAIIYENRPQLVFGAKNYEPEA